jgi:hypothetical protein
MTASEGQIGHALTTVIALVITRCTSGFGHNLLFPGDWRSVEIARNSGHLQFPGCCMLSGACSAPLIKLGDSPATTASALKPADCISDTTTEYFRLIRAMVR